MEPRAESPRGRSARREPRDAEMSRALARAASAVRRLIAEKNDKKAVEEAKRAHKIYATAESEALLTEAYLARAKGLAGRGLVAEGRLVLDLLDERHPASRERVADLRIAFAGRAGDVDSLLRPLCDPDLPAARRTAIEQAIARQLTDPSRIADSTVLPAGHPLREAARALVRAFELATSRPVTDDEIALAEISRRSPLSAWKLLVRAIALFHRGDDGGCRRSLAAIDPDAAPARLAPILDALMSGEGTEKLRGAAARLAARIRGADDLLREPFALLDRALSERKQKEIFQRIQDAVRACGESAPALLDPLRQRISIRCLLLGLDANRVASACGGPSLKDAHFWRLFARAAEIKGDPAMAAGLWEEFRRNAIAQGWFRAGGIEEAAVYLYMAEIVRRYSPDELPDVRRSYEMRIGNGFANYYRGQPEEVREAAPKASSPGDRLYFLDPDRLYAKACAIDPDAEDFRAWLEWTKEGGGDAAALDRVAEKWRDSAPSDPRPILALMESAEKRKALQKALGYLERAEAIDGLNPEVRRARLRLEIATLVRHLQQRKSHLADKDFARLDALPQAKDGDRPSAIAAFRWVCAKIRGDQAGLRASEEEIATGLRSPAAAALVVRAAARACSLPAPLLPPLPAPPAAAGDGRNLADLARACTLGRDLNLKIEIPRPWRETLIAETATAAGAIAARPLRWLAESAVDQGEDQLAFALSNLGLALGESEAGWSLLVRAQSLPETLSERRCRCAATAAEIGRTQGDRELVEQAIELVREEVSGPFSIFPSGAPLPPELTSLTPDKMRKTIAEERKASAYPKAGEGRPSWLGEDEQEEEPRHEDESPFDAVYDFLESSGVFDEESGEDEDDDDDDDEFIPGMPRGLPPEITKAMFQAMLRQVSQGRIPESFEDLVHRDPTLRATMEKFLAEQIGRLKPPARKKPPKKRKDR